MINLGQNGWAKPVPPYITYPVQNLAWGKNDERPPYAPAKFTPTGQTMMAPIPPPKSPWKGPEPVIKAVPPASPSGKGPLPAKDWFNLFNR